MKKSIEQFNSRAGFLFATMGCAIGLGNIWRFPAQVAAYGGGCFILLYLFFVILIGYPLVVAKLAWGRGQQTSIDKLYRHHPYWKKIGLFSVFTAFFTYAFYNLITTKVVGYLSLSLSGQLYQYKQFDLLYSQLSRQLPFQLIGLATLLFITGAINFYGIQKGIERVSKILMPLFFCLLFFLVLYAFSLPKAKEGLTLLFYPNWPSFWQHRWQAVLGALGQSFLSLSIGCSQLILYGSYLPKKDPIEQSALFIVLADTIVALMAACFLFPMLAGQGNEMKGGSDLAFILLPAIFKTLPGLAGWLIGSLFFLLLLFAAITSCISLLEVPTSYLVGKWQLSRQRSMSYVLLSSGLIGVAGILEAGGYQLWPKSLDSFHLITWLGEVVIDYCLTISALLFTLFIGYGWKTRQLEKEVVKEKEWPFVKQWVVSFLFKRVIPILIFISLVSNFLAQMV